MNKVQPKLEELFKTEIGSVDLLSISQFVDRFFSSEEYEKNFSEKMSKLNLSFDYSNPIDKKILDVSNSLVKMPSKLAFYAAGYMFVGAAAKYVDEKPIIVHRVFYNPTYYKRNVLDLLVAHELGHLVHGSIIGPRKQQENVKGSRKFYEAFANYAAYKYFESEGRENTIHKDRKLNKIEDAKLFEFAFNKNLIKEVLNDDLMYRWLRGETMEKNEIEKLNKIYWEKTKEIIPHNLDVPYLIVDSFRNAFNEFHNSIYKENKDVGVLGPDVPTSMTLATSGKFVDFNLYFGGILIPENCLEDNVKQTKMGLVHEQFHEVLRDKSLIYGLNMVFHGNPQIQNVFNRFTEYMVHNYTAQLLEKEGIQKNEYFDMVVNLYNPRGKKFYGLNENSIPMTPEEELKITLEQHAEVWELTNKYDPVNQFVFCFKEFMDYSNFDKQTEISSIQLYNQVMNASSIIQKRIHDGTWQNIAPLKFQKQQ